jgi:hypothetical protein
VTPVRQANLLFSENEHNQSEFRVKFALNQYEPKLNSLDNFGANFKHQPTFIQIHLNSLDLKTMYKRGDINAS